MVLVYLLCTVPGHHHPSPRDEAGAGADFLCQRPGDDGWDEYIVPCMDFVDKHVRGVPGAK